jgi:hypothetical protein
LIFTSDDSLSYLIKPPPPDGLSTITAHDLLVMKEKIGVVLGEEDFDPTRESGFEEESVKKNGFVGRGSTRAEVSSMADSNHANDADEDIPQVAQETWDTVTDNTSQARKGNSDLLPSTLATRVESGLDSFLVTDKLDQKAHDTMDKEKRSLHDAQISLTEIIQIECTLKQSRILVNLELEAPAEHFVITLQNKSGRLKEEFNRNTDVIRFTNEREAEGGFFLPLDESSLIDDWYSAIEWIRENKRSKSPHVYALIELDVGSNESDTSYIMSSKENIVDGPLLTFTDTSLPGSRASSLSGSQPAIPPNPILVAESEAYYNEGTVDPANFFAPAELREERYSTSHTISPNADVEIQPSDVISKLSSRSTHPGPKPHASRAPDVDGPALTLTEPSPPVSRPSTPPSKLSVEGEGPYDSG